MRSVNRIFLNFFTAYIVLIMIPLLTGLFLNNAIVREYEQYVKISHLTHLKKTQDVLESFIEDIKWSTYKLAGNTKLLRLISDEDKKLSDLERSSLIRETMIELNNSLLYNTSFNSIFYIYLKAQDIIITPYSIYKHSDFNDSVNFFKMEKTVSSDWHEDISSRYFQGKILPVRSVIIEDFKNKRMIPYVQTLPIDQSKEIKNIDGAIVYLIGEADFNTFLDNKNLPPGSISYIANDKNELISLVSKSSEDFEPLQLDGDEGMIEQIINNRKMFIIYTTSKRNNWKYVSILPEEWVLKSISFYQVLSISVMLIALIFCLSAAISLSQRWSMPILSSYRSISGYLNKETKEKVSFRSLNSNVKELIHYSEDMQDELLSQKVFVHNAFVNRLINGLFRSEKNLEKYLKHLGFNLQENFFNIAIISQGDMGFAGTTESFDEMVRVKNYLKLRLQREIPIRMMISELENSNLVLILLTSSENEIIHEKSIRDAIESFCVELPQMYSDNLLIALGETTDSLMKIHNSYIQALDILSSIEAIEKQTIIHFDELDKKKEDFYFPMELESRLINSVKAGNIETLESLLEILYRENLEDRFLDSHKMKIFLSSLYSTCFRVLNQVPDRIKDELTVLPDRYEFEPAFDTIKSFLYDVCHIQNKNKKSHNNTLIDKVKDFLEKNYSNKNISLYMVAEYFSISESYLSFFFKEQTGTNFSTFLENIRMKNARELLTDTDEPIHIIAGKIGYNSDKTFRRVFQKSFNISPGKYRESI